MENNLSAKKNIISKSFWRLVIVNMVVIGATNVCGFIDNIVISRYLGDLPLAAVGYFSPVQVISGLCYVIVLGVVVLCGNFIGSGQKEKVISLFNTAFITLLVGYGLFSVLVILFRGQLAPVLGASGETVKYLEDYMLGYAPGILFSALGALLVSISGFNNDIGKSYIGTAALFVGNFVFDILLVGPMGILGIGLASTISCFALFIVLLPGFFSESKTIHFKRVPFDIALLKETAVRGMPSLLFTIGMLFKNSLLNYSLNVSVGYAGLAVVNVMASICNLTGTVSGGFVNAYSALGSLFYGEEDKRGFVHLFRLTLIYGLLSVVIILALLIGFSSTLANIFFEPGTLTWNLGKMMLILGYTYAPINMIFNILMCSYKSSGRMKLVNVMSFLETALIGIIALITVPMFSANAAWLANTFSDIICLIIILISVVVWKKGFTASIPDLMKLPSDFGAGDNELVEYTIDTMEELSAVSEKVIKFCKSKDVDSKKSFWTGLCVEEITRNILQHGGYKGRRNNVNVRVVKKDCLTITIQDDCQKFDPCERIKMHTPDSPESNIGLRMVAKLATSMDYYNNAGINTMIIKL